MGSEVSQSVKTDAPYIGPRPFGAPYIGPRPFGDSLEDQKRFFGRDYEAEEIISLIMAHDTLIIYAQSGAGKTSIINAQIGPNLEKDGFKILPIARVKIASDIPYESLLANTDSSMPVAFLIFTCSMLCTA